MSEAQARRQDELDQALAEGLIGVPEYVLGMLDAGALREDLASADPATRVAATFAARNRREARVVRLLVQALADPEEEVRLFAAEALELNDARFLAALRELRSQVDAASSPDPALLRRLGLLLHRYAEVMAIEPGLAQRWHRRALERLEPLAAGDPPVAFACGLSRARCGDLEAAVGYLEPLAATGDQPRAAAALVDVYLRQGRLGEVRRLAATLVEDPIVGAAARSWTREAEA